MDRWLYYFSGILYGMIEKVGDSIHIARRDMQAGSFQAWVELTPAISGEMKKWGSLDVLQAIRSIPEITAAFAHGGETVCFQDSRYSMREEGLYVQRNTASPMDMLFLEGRLIAFLCAARDGTVVLVKEGFEKYTVLKRWERIGEQDKIYGVRRIENEMALMRDGVRLATDIYLPEGKQGRMPTILVRTPYGKFRNEHLYYRYAQRGYAVVLQDVRGREQSEGEFIPNYHEVEDGDDTLNFIAEKDWCDGKIGMIGGSYLGYVQWAAAASGNEHLRAMVSIVTAGSAFTDIPRRGGCFVSGMLAWAFAMSKRTFAPELMAQADWDALLNVRPLEDIPKKALGHEIPFLNEWLKRPDYDAFWERGDWFKRMPENMQIPAMIVSGWFDDDGMGTTEALDLIKDYPAGRAKIILGPWNHNANSRYDIHGVPVGTNALRYDLDLQYLRFFDRHLKGSENGIEQERKIEYFTLAENRWKQADVWPPSRKTLTLYLSGMDAKGAGGALQRETPEVGGNTYTYDPNDPALHLIDMAENEIAVPADYTEQEKRNDVLVYTTEPLENDLTVTGDILVELYVSSDAVDTDFIVRLTEVDEEGRSIKLADGMLCAKYRDGFETPKYMESGQVYCVQVRTTKISKRFEAGKRIRLTITSSAKNFTFPNSNTKEGYNSSETIVAKNRVHHGGIHASRVVLPIE
ncbi:CocE/NonD family hydrolase [Christensenellaceae bacterium OttesenSCG-928-M15]|nr:CocE/NonD family hydrolase [Christensenellaceae bacterium OttesenSCG-928-M15]